MSQKPDKLPNIVTGISEVQELTNILKGIGVDYTSRLNTLLSSLNTIAILANSEEARRKLNVPIEAVDRLVEDTLNRATVCYYIVSLVTSILQSPDTLEKSLTTLKSAVRAGYFIDAKEELRKEPDEQVENLGCQPEADEEQPEVDANQPGDIDANQPEVVGQATDKKQ